MVWGGDGVVRVPHVARRGQLGGWEKMFRSSYRMNPIYGNIQQLLGHSLHQARRFSTVLHKFGISIKFDFVFFSSVFSGFCLLYNQVEVFVYRKCQISLFVCSMIRKDRMNLYGIFV